MPVHAVQLLNNYIAAFNRHDIAAIKTMLDDDIIVLVNGREVASGRDKILPSYEKDFAINKTVSVGVQPFEVDGEPGVVQVGLIAMEPASQQDKVKTTSLTVRYHYGSEGRQTRHEISGIVVSGDNREEAPSGVIALLTNLLQACPCSHLPSSRCTATQMKGLMAVK
jgi:ketosteroid isomerase-like protein